MTTERESLIEFPCDFPIKIFGLANTEFEMATYSIIHKHVPDLPETAIKMRHSKDKKYLSLTITVRVGSQEHLDAIYLELNAHDAILMTL